MPASPFPLFESHHPVSFRARGVAAPFTTPLLAGTRIRDSSLTGIELVVPNPAGGRGVYILNWQGVRALCNPTVHDTVLFRRVSRLKDIDPASIRNVALEIALEGHAGREAAAAAEAAMATDRSQRLLAHFLLTMKLVEQVDPNGMKATSLAERTPDLDRRASAALHHVGVSLGRPAARLAEGLAAVGDALSPLGISPRDRAARIPRMISRLEQTHTGLAQWLDTDPDHDIEGLGRAIAAAIGRLPDSVDILLKTARAAAADPTALLKRWIDDPGTTIALATRCDWLLDGWDHVCLLWQNAATTACRRAALLEMAQLVPMPPREVLEWSDLSFPPELLEQAFRVISRDDAWRKGSAAFALIERNEKLRAMSA